MSKLNVLFRSKSAIFYALVTLSSAALAFAQSAEKFYYWVIPAYTVREESFVIEVDAAQKAEIDRILAARGSPDFGGYIAAGPVPYNRNYYAPGQPVWNWHVASITNIFDLKGTAFPAVVDPNLDAFPSDIAADPERWIRENGPEYTPRYFTILREVDPSKKDALVNVSNRGLAGSGERTLIAGLIISGGSPRNVVVRALGPSLASRGVQNVAANPKLELYGASGRRGSSNSDWRQDARANTLRTSIPSLVPENEKEAAMLLTLLPGAYTMHGINEDGTEGVMLLEAYDVDAGSD